MNDPYTLTPDRAAEPELGAQPDLRWRRGRDVADELDGYWLGAFVMAGTNSRIVRRSNALLDYAYGRRLEYAEQMSMGRSIGGAGCSRAGDRRQRRGHGAWRPILQPAATETRRPNRAETRHRSE